MILLASFCGSALTDEDGDDIQWMPPGVHEIQPHTTDGEVKKVTVLVDEAAAQAVEKARAQYQAAFDAGQGDAPFLDFCHADQEASAWVKRVYWGGDDPQKGGVRLVLDWTDEGRAKKGKSLKRFSPGFYLTEQPDADGYHHVTGAPANMGGLVNRAAFRTIQSLSASATTEGGENQDNNQDKNTTMTEDEIKALQAENESLKKQLEDLQKSVSDMKEKDAEATVEAACAAGKIQPSLKASWKETLLKNPSAKELLASLPSNPAFQAAYKPEDNKDDAPKGKALLASYNSIEDPDKRFVFFQEHEKELIAARQ